MTSREVEEIKAHFDSRVTEVKGHFDRTVGEVKDTLRGEMAGLGDTLRGEIAEVRREAGAHAEDLRSEIRLVADGVALANERIDRLDLRVDDLTGEMRRGFAGVRADIRRLHETDDELRQRIENAERREA